MMNKKFLTFTEDLSTKYEALISMKPVTVDNLPTDSPNGGIYLFTENGQNMYAGRTRRKISKRLHDHVSGAKDSPFAWRLAREKTGKRAAYKTVWSRPELLKDPSFKSEYESAKQRIRKMHIRYVGEANPLKQALLEIYVAVVSGALHNDFDTH